MIGLRDIVYRILILWLVFIGAVLINELWGVFYFSSLIFLLFFIVLFLSSGNFITAFCDPFKDLSEEFLINISFGVGLWSLVVFLVGIAGFLYRSIFLVLAVIAVAGSIKYIKDYCIKFKRVEIDFAGLKQGFFCSIPVVFLVPAFFFTLFPPTFYDSLVYHLALPQRYIFQHFIDFPSWNHFAFFPLGQEMIYSLILLLTEDPVVTKLFNFLTGGLLLITLWKISECIEDNTTAKLASVSLMASCPCFVLLLTIPKNDLAVSLFQCLGVLGLLRFWNTESKKWIYLSGFFIGIGLGYKYTTLLFFVAFLLAVCVVKAFSSSEVISYRNLAILVIVALIVGSPWYIKNLIVTGNPVYPAFSSFIGKKGFRNFEVEKSYIESSPSFREFILLPWNMTLHSSEYGVIGEVGFAFLLLFPFSVYYFRNDSRMLFLIAVFLSYFLLWAFSLHSNRFLLAGFGLLSVVCGHTLIKLFESRKSLSYLIWTVIICVFLLNLFHFFYTGGYIFHGVEKMYPQNISKILRREVNYYPAAEYINSNLPEDSHIFLVGEARTFYFKVKTTANTALDETLIVEFAARSQTPEDLIDLLKDRGITHILLNRPEAERLQKKYDYFDWESHADKEVYDDVLPACEVIFKGNGVTIYELP